MEEFINTIKTMQSDISISKKRIEVLEDKANKKLDFNIWGYDKASQILGCCRQTLSKMVKSDKFFTHGVDYFSNGSCTVFSISSLLNIKKGVKYEKKTRANK